MATIVAANCLWLRLDFGASYLVSEKKGSRPGYVIEHTDRVFVLDRNGFVLDTQSDLRTADQILKTIRARL